FVDFLFHNGLEARTVKLAANDYYTPEVRLLPDRPGGSDASNPGPPVSTALDCRSLSSQGQ
ncbi:MAG TPA: hypothetical protein VGI34_05480, partial [Candidatus Acidoferrales bacterium]